MLDCQTLSHGSTLCNQHHNTEGVDTGGFSPGKGIPGQYLDIGNFSLEDCGLLKKVFEILVPRSAADFGPLDIEAKLIGLHVYSGPDGGFPPHVDTARGHEHFASLVVVLPTYFEGGQFKLSGHEVKYDPQPTGDILSSWGPGLKWVAYYSDCQAEVLPVSKQHRVTLEYRLFTKTSSALRPSPPDEAGHFSVKSQKMLLMPNFMRRGGILGFYSQHLYPTAPQGFHFSDDYRASFEVLKGYDAIVFGNFAALNLAVHLRPADIHGKNDLGCRYPTLAKLTESLTEKESTNLFAVLDNTDYQTVVNEFTHHMHDGLFAEKVLHGIDWFYHPDDKFQWIYN
ncbi:hypothetical protein GE09DRAFT_28969 [Coniochaeta sp. 2T2.1]|nr:hypothetical protein GE09DRAFT_28969 [Coniochaeta sp. 2T2.1]